ncbi:MAG: HDIG domain-containing metalloprotein [Litorilinea sp.]
MTGSGLRQWFPWNRWFTISGLIGLSTLMLIAVLAWQLPFGSQIQLGVGEVAPFDVVAPRQITYESQILTDQARERAAQAVPDQYDNPDARVRRQQIDRARAILDYISIVRLDPYASTELQTDYLMAVTDFTLTPEIVLQILTATDAEWNAVVTEVPLALDRVMRDEIRESGLVAARRRVPTLINPDMSERAGYITGEITRGLARANSAFNATRTEELRERASSEVPMIQVTMERNEAIIRAGDLATAETVEALQQIGLMQGDWNWWVLIRAVLFALALVTLAVGALYRLRSELAQHLEEIALIVVVTGIWLTIAKFMLIPHDWLPYLYPLAALSMLLAVLIDLRVSVVLTLTLLLVVQYLAPNNTPLVAYLGIGSLVGALILGRAERISVFVWAGLGVALCNIVVFAAFRAPFPDYSLARLSQMVLVVALNGGLSASVALIGYLILGNIFGITTSLQLTELSRPTHPLLRQVLLKASGTYHHTIVVSNMAERAAAAIGADAYLTRVGAYYHDIGKTVRPYFFTENIMEGNSPHDKLDPLTSAQVIISHVSDGVDLAQKYRLPERIQDFIREHHGRSVMRYFYVQAQQKAKNPAEVDEADFRYPGPNPRTKETAILLLADTCEAAVRAIRPSTREDLETLVNRLIEERLDDGELNESNLTFRELQMIKEIFLQVLQGVHHPRIQYPEPMTTEKAALVIEDGRPAGAPPGQPQSQPTSTQPTPKQPSQPTAPQVVPPAQPQKQPQKQPETQPQSAGRETSAPANGASDQAKAQRAATNNGGTAATDAARDTAIPASPAESDSRAADAGQVEPVATPRDETPAQTKNNTSLPGGAEAPADEQ